MTTATSPITPAQYQAALERAAQDDVIVIKKTTQDYGFGRNVETTFHVFSGKSKTIYFVTLTPAQTGFICNCEAGNNGVYCKHRAQVHADIEAKIFSL